MSKRMLILGGSAGSLEFILRLLPSLDAKKHLVIVIVLHRKNVAESPLVDLLAGRSSWIVKEAEEKEMAQAGTIYVAPADYHLLLEHDETFSLDYSEKINYSRPSIDSTFESAAECYKHALACLLLSGSNADGTKGMQAVKKNGGITAVQDPSTCEIPYMPQQALAHVSIDLIVSHDNVNNFIQIL